ncbi:SpoIIE family protein phosphatase [Streptomyces sp. NPDC089799]|uniref:SpoIIE family protein phosphatase n=1 Tax=Streptomyces sp. NPDC089799 TaxID=3155066 RepID=UPI00341A2918
MTGRPDDGGRVPDELALVLAQATVGAIEAVGGYAGGVYLRSSTPGLLRLAAIGGLPVPLFRPWWRMNANRPYPAAEAHRTGHAVLLANADEAMRRYPQLMAGLPFPFGSLYVPVVAGPERFGVLMVLRAATPGAVVSGTDGRRIRQAARDLAGRLAGLAAVGTPVVWEDEPAGVSLPAHATTPLRTGHLHWDLDTGLITPDEDLCAIAGLDPADFPAGLDEFTRSWLPEDRNGLWVVARELADPHGPPARRLAMHARDGRRLILNLEALPGRPGRTGGTADVPAGPGRAGQGHEDAAGGSRPLSGLVLDLGRGPLTDQAADRLPQALLSLDRLGRITYANDGVPALLGPTRAELSGRVLWEAMPWLGHPAYEDYFRAVMMGTDSVQFMARRSPKEWFSVFLHSGPGGITVAVTAEEHPAYAPGSRVRPGPGPGSPADRAGALYRPVALAIALTEAVTPRQVSAVVTDELLPAFGGRQLAIYLLNERHLYLAWETGFPQGFLDPFDGVSLEVRLPGVETLTSGRPIFFESMEHLAAAYPGIPLDADVGARAFLPLIASGRPVGSCILGFDRPRGFSPEERTVLTALAGLIAQALERAQRYESEAAVARGLQDALLPRHLPVVDEVETLGRYLPGTAGMDIGGDWYDVIETGSGGLAVVIGDVQGHGIPAASTMGQLRSAVRAFALSGNEPEDVVGGTNRLLIDLDPGQFASCCYIDLDPASGAARAVRAGHPQPLLRHPDGLTEVLDLPGGVVLGVDGEATYPVTDLHLERGAVLALYTDGLVEQPGTDIDVGVERLRVLLAESGAGSLAETADRLIREAGEAADRPDDVALLLAARHSPEWRQAS